MDIKLCKSWKNILQTELQKSYYTALWQKLTLDYESRTIYPPEELIFNAFNQTAFADVKVVILGQDPYHGAGQAMGLSFSVPGGVKIPPSLRNIFKEIQSDIGTPAPESGDLTRLAKQGVLLLNSVLTVRGSAAASHANYGWEHFTDAVMKTISNEKDHVVFLLWGTYAGKKTALIDQKKHLVLTAPHPSPLSAHKGFLGCQHFSKTNEYLGRNNQAPIVW